MQSKITVASPVFKTVLIAIFKLIVLLCAFMVMLFFSYLY